MHIGMVRLQALSVKPALEVESVETVDIVFTVPDLCLTLFIRPICKPYWLGFTGYS